jgi:hypothetical protein
MLIYSISICIDTSNPDDIDDTDNTDEGLFVNHGMFEQGSIAGVKVAIEADLNVGKVSMKPPPTFREIIKHVASRKTTNKQFGVHIELKYGLFRKKALRKLIDILFEYNVPAYIEYRTDERKKFMRDYINEKQLFALQVSV